MFDTLLKIPAGDGFESDWTNRWEAEVALLTHRVKDHETKISRLRAEQIADLRRLEALDADLDFGAKSMAEWARANLDVSHQTASHMMRIAQENQPDIEARMAAGEYGIDRADLLCRLRSLNGPEEVITDSTDYSLGHLYGMVDRLRRVGRFEEQSDHENRYLVVQPDLEDSGYKFWGHTTAVDGRIIESALDKRLDELPNLPHQSTGQRRVDALVSICLDSLTSHSIGGQGGRAVTVCEVFVDATLAASSFGEKGATVSTGPRVGPGALSEILCEGKVRVIHQGADGRPIGVSDQAEAIPPAVRSYVLLRDQGRCAIDGCNSRYRLQPHHIFQRCHGGDHDPENLITLCWYHHHTAIHMLGMTIDELSPKHRRRLQPLFSHGPPPIPRLSLIAPSIT